MNIKNKWKRKRLKKRLYKKKGIGGNRKSSRHRKGAGRCSNMSCLNNLLYVLKINKDAVQNYMQKKKRIDTRLELGRKFNSII
jgi:hypothetical protein